MTKDDILQALRLTAMGRTGHPLQEQLAETIADLRAAQQKFEEALLAPLSPMPTRFQGIEQFIATTEPPKRRKKAD